MRAGTRVSLSFPCVWDDHNVGVAIGRADTLHLGQRPLKSTKDWVIKSHRPAAVVAISESV